MTIRYIFGWIILLVVAIINGAIREMVYKNHFGELRAHQISTLTGIILFGVIIWEMSRVWPLPSAKQAWAVGLIWLMLTVAFEFLFGHFVMGHPWSKLFYDYDILAGRVWLLVLIWTTVAPFVFYKTGSH